MEDSSESFVHETAIWGKSFNVIMWLYDLNPTCYTQSHKHGSSYLLAEVTQCRNVHRSKWHKIESLSKPETGTLPEFPLPPPPYLTKHSWTTLDLNRLRFLSFLSTINFVLSKIKLNTDILLFMVPKSIKWPPFHNEYNRRQEEGRWVFDASGQSKRQSEWSDIRRRDTEKRRSNPGRCAQTQQNHRKSVKSSRKSLMFLIVIDVFPLHCSGHGRLIWNFVCSHSDRPFPSGNFKLMYCTVCLVYLLNRPCSSFKLPRGRGDLRAAYKVSNACGNLHTFTTCYSFMLPKRCTENYLFWADIPLKMHTCQPLETQMREISLIGSLQWGRFCVSAIRDIFKTLWYH